MSDQQDGARRVRDRYRYMLEFIGQSKGGRHIREIEGKMFKDFGLIPKTTRRYVEYGVRYGDLMYTSTAQSRVKVIEV